MNLDIHPFNFPNDQAKLVWNGILETDHFSNGFFMSNEESNRLFKNLPCANILGHLNTDEIESIFLWLECGLYVLNTKTKECKEVLVADCLDFKNPIQAEYKTDECGNLELYWVEQFNYDEDCCSKNPIPGNKDRYVIVDKDCKPLSQFTKEVRDPENPLSGNTITVIDCCKLELGKCYECPELDIEVSTIGGGLTAGIYQFVIQTHDSKTFNNWCTPTNPVSISNEDYNNFDCFAGAAPDTPTNHSINVTITGVDEPFFRLAVIRTINGVITPFIVGEYSSEGGSQSITYTGDHLENISLEEILTPSISYEWSADIRRYNNKLLKAGVCDRRNIDYQRYANQIKTSVCTIKVPTDASYNLPENVVEIKSAMRDEVYAGAIRWVFCDGTKSEYFHIPGPTKEEVQECIDNSPETIIIENCLTSLNFSGTCTPGLSQPKFISGALDPNIIITSVTPDIGGGVSCVTNLSWIQQPDGSFSISFTTVGCDCYNNGLTFTLGLAVNGIPANELVLVTDVTYQGGEGEVGTLSISAFNEEPWCQSIIDTFSSDSGIWNNFQNHMEDSSFWDQTNHQFDIDSIVPACHPDNFIGCDAPVWEIYNTACITGKPHKETKITVECGETDIEIQPWECATLAYWESADHVYPEIEISCKVDENGDPLLMYGDLTGQPVRYWKMPDTRLMCHFSSDIPYFPEDPEDDCVETSQPSSSSEYTFPYDDYPYGTFTVPVEVSPVERGMPGADPVVPFGSANHLEQGSVQKPYQDSYVYPMLLVFEDIAVPDELGECKDIVGYEISIVTRTEFNKSVIAKGTTHNTFAGKVGSEYYAFPMHAINSNTWIDHTIDIGDEDRSFSYPLSNREELIGEFEAESDNDWDTCYVSGDDPESIEQRACCYVDAKILHSPNTHFSQVKVQGDYIKVEKQLCGGGIFYGNHDYEDKWATRLNINLYETHRANTGNIHRRLSGIQYVNENSLSVNTAGITYPLNNLSRESSIYFEINKNPCGEEDNCVYPLKLYKDCTLCRQWEGQWGCAHTTFGFGSGWLEDSDAVRIRQACWPPLVAEITDHSFVWFLHGAWTVSSDSSCVETWIPRHKQIRRATTHYISVKKYLKNQYGSVSSLIYGTCITNGKIKYDEDDIPYIDDKSFVGVDSFVNYWSYLRTARWTDFRQITNDSWESYDTEWCSTGINQPEASGVVNTLVHSWYESDINVAFRYDDPQNKCYFYPHSVCKNELQLDPSFDQNLSYDNSLLTQYYLKSTGNDSSVREEINPGTDNCKLYSIDHSKTNVFCGGPNINLDYDVCCLNCFPTRVIWSESQVLTSLENSWRTYLANNFIDLPKHTGGITRLINLGNEIYSHTTEALWRVQATQQQLNIGPEIVYVGSGDLFSQTPVQIYVSPEGYGGLQFKEASFQNEFGYFWVDAKADKIHQLAGQGQIKEISNNGLRNFFKENKLSNYSSDRPFLFGFDHRHNRLLFTKRDEFTLSYMPDREQWISFHSYLPDYYLQDRKDMWTFKNDVTNPNNNNSIWLHNRNCTSFQTFYGSRNPFILEVVLSVQSQRDLESLYVVLESYKHNVSNPISPEELENCTSCEAVKQFYDKMHIYNYCQSSGILPVHVKENGSDVEEIRQAIIASNDCSRWDINGWRDAKCDNLCPYPNYPFLDDQYSEELSFTETENSFTENNSTISCNYYIIRFILDKTENRIYHLTHSLHQMPNTNERSS